MNQRSLSTIRRRSFSIFRRAGVCLLAALTGCLNPPAHPDIGTGCCGDMKRGVALVKQVAGDTALQSTTAPLSSSAQVACSFFSGIVYTGRDFVTKHFLLPFLGHPGPLPADGGDEGKHDREPFKPSSKHPLLPADVHFEVDGAEALRTLESLFGSAAQRIDVLIYMWDSDALGWGLARSLAAKAEELAAAGNCAPTVRVIVDGGGNLIHGPPDKKKTSDVNEVLGWLGAQPHVEVLRTRNGFACFDHRKLVIVDETAAWSGGRNFTVASFFEYHDLSYTLRGPLVKDMQAAYEEAWRKAGGKTSGQWAVGSGQKTHEDAQSSAIDGQSPSSAHWPLATAHFVANAEACVVGTGPFQRDLSHAVYGAVDRASKHIFLENPYFTDNTLWCKLARARRRGVDTRVIFARDAQSNIIDRAMRVTTNRLLRAGIRVYIHPGTTHVKAACVDGLWAYLGTGNFDNLSLRRNNEIGLSIGGGPLIQEIETRLFEADFQPEWEITEPLQVSFGDYVCEVLANLVL